MSLIIREMQTKKNNDYPSKGPKPASASEDAGVLLNAATIWNTMEVSPRFKKKNRSRICSSTPTGRDISKGNKINMSKRHLHSHAHYSTIHGSRNGNILRTRQLMKGWRRTMWAQQRVDPASQDTEAETSTWSEKEGMHKRSRSTQFPQCGIFVNTILMLKVDW